MKCNCCILQQDNRIVNLLYITSSLKKNVISQFHNKKRLKSYFNNHHDIKLNLFCIIIMQLNTVCVHSAEYSSQRGRTLGSLHDSVSETFF